MKVSNMVSSKGNKVANQFIIQDDDCNVSYFQSYNTMIAMVSDDGKFIDYQWQYSRTTSKYLYQFLGMNRKQIETGIKDGSITVTDLNS